MVNTITNRFAVNNSVLAIVRTTNPVGNVKLDRNVTSEGFSRRRDDAPPEITRSKRAPREIKDPARKDLRNKSGQANRAFPMPETVSLAAVSFIGMKVSIILTDGTGDELRVIHFLSDRWPYT